MPQQVYLQSGPKQKGFTLIEVLVASSILIVGLASILTLYSSSIKAISLAKNYEEAGMAAESIMAETLFAAHKTPFKIQGKSNHPFGATWEAVGMPGNGDKPDQIKITVRFKNSGKLRFIELITSQFQLNLKSK